MHPAHHKECRSWPLPFKNGQSGFGRGAFREFFANRLLCGVQNNRQSGQNCCCGQQAETLAPVPMQVHPICLLPIKWLSEPMPQALFPPVFSLNIGQPVQASILQSA